MGATLHKVRVLVWGEAPDTKEERRVTCLVDCDFACDMTADSGSQLLQKIDFFILV